MTKGLENDEPPPPVLIVEDEWLIADIIEQTLDESGYRTAGPVNSVDAALKIIATTSLAAAILDVNLGPERSFPIAERLAELKIPFVFMTGYNVADLPPPYRHYTALAKPVTPEKLVRAVAVLLAGRNRNECDSRKPCPARHRDGPRTRQDPSP
jgi:DNA-binding response OmpR family regulator